MQTRNRQMAVLVAAMAAVSSFVGHAEGAVIWVGTTSSDYTVAGNWQSSAAPTHSYDTASIGTSTPNPTVVNSATIAINDISIGGTGSLTINQGGSVSVGSGIVVGDASGGSATLTLQTTGAASVTHTGGPAQSLTVGAVSGAVGTVQGYGTFGLPIKLTNNGKIIANGYGVSNTLDLSSFSNNGQSQYVDHTFNNAGNGWYATGKGKLGLATVVLVTDSVTNNGSFNWGEVGVRGGSGRQTSTATALTANSLVNSVQMHLTDVLGFDASISDRQTISLLALDNSAVPAAAPGGINFIGVWNMVDAGSFYNFGSHPNPLTSYTFRYDDVAAASQAASVYKWNGSTWANMTLGLSDTGFSVASTDTSLVASSSNFYAVGVAVPEPATLSLLGGGSALLLMSRRRRRA